MEIDTGSAVSLISDSVFSSVFETTSLQETKVKLCTYSGEQLPVKSKITCEVSYNGQTYTLPLIVLTGEGPTLLGVIGCNRSDHTTRLRFFRLKHSEKKFTCNHCYDL